MPPGSHRERYTFHGNLRDTRYGWLRLTPAYSVHLVEEVLNERARPDLPVLDPFCGTGTTLLACAEQGLDCDTVDLNPFLLWLARAKAARYTQGNIAHASGAVAAMAARAARPRRREPWTPPIHNVDRWWSPPARHALGRAFEHIREARLSRPARDLALLAFCRALIETALVSFGHQSMSFRAGREEGEREAAQRVSDALGSAIESLVAAASMPMPRSNVRAVEGDSRALGVCLGDRRYGTVLTSPPYANRMSYIRELRPYMYWLGYLVERRDAGELDWRAIGGTWGAATSNLNSWRPAPGRRVPVSGFDQVVAAIAARSPVLSRYVHRYFVDMTAHARSLYPLVGRGGRVVYVIGNSKFYDVLVPAERMLAEILEATRFRRAEIHALRRRTSKSELFEYLVSASKG
jgi:hypothetical protein